MHFSRPYRRITTVTLLLVSLFLSLTSLSQAQPGPNWGAAPAESFFNLQGTLAPGDSIQPSYPETGRDTHRFNFSLAVRDSGPVMLTIENAAGDVLWDGQAEAGETVWGYGIFTRGANQLTLVNNGGSSAAYTLNFYDLPDAPYLWEGVATGSGLNSEAWVNFPASGLYTFDVAASSGRYQFLLDGAYIQKTVESPGDAVSYYVPAGRHALRVVQDTSLGAAWQVDIAAVGATSDTLPYEQTGGLLGATFAEAWLPINLDAATSANLALTLTGNAGDQLRLELYNPGAATPVVSLDPVYSGETVWATMDLEAGTSRLHLVAEGGNSAGLAYELAISTLETPAASWSGVANAGGLNSQIRMSFADAGLYTFTLASGTGRFQLELNDNYLLKTVEENSAPASTYYVPAGTHTLTVIQDGSTGADWSVEIGAAGAANNSLPYAQSGGELGGSSNPFGEAWLPISLENAAPVNMNLTLDGAAADSLVVEVYQGNTITPTVTLDKVQGGEETWATFDLAAGANRLRLATNGANTAPLSYQLLLESVPEDSATWSGRSLDNGLNSEFTVNFSETATYQFDIDADEGFANLLLDSFARRQPAATQGTSYQIMVPAGEHIIHTVEDPAFPITDWSASVIPVTAGPSFFTFTGTLGNGQTLVPQYTLANGSLDFNFEFAVNGSGPVDLTIENGSSSQIWSGSALAGETLWDSGTLTAGNNALTLTNNSGAPANVALTLYELPDTPYKWEGVAEGAGLNSHSRVTFPESGLYTFDFGTSGGRYQFRLDDIGGATPHILKTVEDTTSVTYFVPSGTHDLFIDQDSTTTSPWAVEISAAAATSDTLPYEKEGGLLGGAGNDFAEEWLPIYMEGATAANLSTTLVGSAGDSAVLTVYDENQQVLTTPTIYAGETLWSSFDLPAGTSLIHLQADGANSTALDYELTLHTIPDPAYTWQGEAVATGENSRIRFTFPADGLYTFGLDATAGRYQFQVEDETILKTVEGSTSTTYYVEAGTHELTINQDDALGATWEVAISTAGPAADTLPYARSGGNLGGSGNEFTEAWMPIYLGAAAKVNVEMAVSGSLDDALMMEVVDATGTPLLMLNGAYGSETVWETVDLPATGARIHLWTAGANTGSLAYDLRVTAVPMPPYTWSGISLDQGVNSTIRLEIPVSGTYQLEVNMPEGFTTLLVDQADTRIAARAPDAFFYSLNIPLAPGFHTFTSDQSNTFPVTSWVVTATLLSAAPPQIDSVSPISASTEATTTVAILGANFQEGAMASLAQDGNSYPLQNIVYVGGSELQGVIPAGLPPATYDVIVTNPDAQSATLPEGLTIIPRPTFYIHLPIVSR